MIKKFLLSILVLGVFAIYAIHLKAGGDETIPVVANTPIATGSGPSPQNKKYRDGTYTGSVADAFYGNIQVQTVITGGKITDVTFLQYPNDRGTSVQINTQAMPLLKQEAIQAQSAKVDGVSGATQTSGAFVQSLTSALQQAS